MKSKVKNLLYIILIVSIVSSSLIYFLILRDDSRNTIKIGIVIPQTGNLAYIGAQIRNGVELAKEEIGDTLIEVIFEDSKGNPNSGISAVNKLISINEVDFLMVNLTSVAIPSIPIISRTESYGFMLSTYPEILEGSKNCFRIFTSGEQEAEIIAKEINSKEVKNLIAIYVNDPYGEGTVTAIKNKLNRTIVEEYRYTLSNPEFQSIISKAKFQDADCCILIGYGFEYEQLFTKFSELNFSPVIFSNFSFSNLKGKNSIDRYKNEIYYTAPVFDIENSQTDPMKTFINNYKAKYNSDPDFNAAYGYDNFRIIHEVITSKKNPNVYLKDNFSYTGAMGSIKIEPSGDCITEMKVINRTP
ncbi:MAG: penicillin-binding protein activator [Ignavibacteriae bacterium]|nr:penicillin-binding protein activator [Ignavibacteriota bacterium]